MKNNMITKEELEQYALENILESDSVEAFEKMQKWIEGALWMQEKSNEKKICLQVGMKVKIKNNTEDYPFEAGKIKTITKQLPDFGKSKAFALDGDDGIWCIEDFEYCVDYPDSKMI